MSRFSSAIVLGLFALLALSCQGREVGAFTWTDGAGRRLSFSRPGTEAADEARLEAGGTSALLKLSSPLDLGAAEAIAVDLGLGGPSTIDLSFIDSAGAEVAKFRIGAPDPSMRLVFAAQKRLRLGGLRISLSADEGSKSVATIEGIRITPFFEGLSHDGNRTILSPGFLLERHGQSLVARLPGPFGAPGPQATPRLLNLRWKAGPDSGSVTVVLQGQKPRHIALRPDSSGIVLPESLFATGAASVEVDMPTSLELLEDSISAGKVSELQPLDLGVILGLPKSDPAPAFEVYRWDARPSVLVFDFADYATQDAALKRLAFFVEKAGFRGRLAPDAEIAGLHGWNAHDYRAADLAAFFAKAAESSFQLGQAEVAVRNVLLGAGVIRASGSSFVPGEGAIVSITRESPSWLRATFMAHEASHGLYFTDPRFADFVRQTWAAVGKDERWFWLLYFGWMNYDTADEDLMADEFMAYLYQQPVARVEEYFTKTLPPRVLENHPDLKPRIDAWMERYGTTFAAHAAVIEDWLRAHYGFVAARPWSWY